MTITRDALVLDDVAQDLLFRNAHTANSFTDAPVTDVQLEAIYDLIKYAPTSMNQQPLRVVVVRSPEARARLVGTMVDGNKAKTQAAPAVLILAADVDFHDDLPRTFPIYPTAREMFAANDDQRADSARFNAGLQMGYYILGIRAAGLAAGPMTGFDAAALELEFFAGTPHRVLAVINIGTPDEGSFRDRLPRLEYSEVVTTI